MQTLKFNIDATTILKEMSDDQLAIAEVYVCHDGNNAHDMPISLETMKMAASTILNKFLVADFDGYDFKDHTNSQKILGFFPAENDLRFVEKDGKTYFVANAIISKIYVPYAYELFLEKNYKSVSMEISVVETQEIDGLEHITKFIFNGVTVLGDNTRPACVKSNAQIFKFSEKEFVDNGNKAYQNYIKECRFGKYDDIDFKIPKKVKENAQRGLDLRKEYGRGGTNVGMSTARYLVSNDTASPEKVRHIAKYFPRHKGDNLDEKNPPSNGWIAWLLWGSDEAWRWSQNIVDRMNKMDEKFSVGEDLGKSDSIKINNSKESAIMSESWDGQGAEFLNKLLNASNHESLVKEAYLVIDSEGDLSVNDVHYPHHSIKDGELVINRKGVISAYQRARQQNLSGEPIKHLERHYRELGLETEKFAEGGNKVDKTKMAEMMAKHESMMKYQIFGMSDECVYAVNTEDKKMYAIPYTSKEEVAEFALDDVKRAKMSCKYEMMQDDEDDDKEVYMAVGKMAKMMGYNDDQNIEAVAQEKENEDESDKMKKEVDMAQMQKDMDDMKVKMSDMVKENDELKKFKSDTMMAEKMAMIDSETAEMAMKVNEKFASDWKEKVEEFSTVKEWSNAMRAEAFSVVVDKVVPEKKNFSAMDIPSTHQTHNQPQKKFWEM